MRFEQLRPLVESALLSRDELLTLKAGTTTYTYNDNGDETAAGSRSYNWNLADEITSTSDGATATNYSYDGDGNRLEAAASTQTTSYLWDTNAPLPRLAIERDGTGSPLRSYEYGSGLVSMLAGGQNYYFHTDAIGSIRTITDSSGQPDWTYSYEPYGTTRTETKNDPMAPKNNARFAGEMLDGHSALYDLRARNFDPSSARFVSPDPHASTNAEPAMNTYGYAADNPLVFVDPAGLHPKTTVEVPAPRVSRQLAAVVGSADGSCTPSPDITPKDLPGPALAAWIKGYEEACQRLHAREADNNRCVGTARWVGGFTFLLAGATFSGISVMLFARLAMMDVASGFGFEAIEGIGGSRLTIALSGLAGIAGFGGAGACLAGLF